MGQEQSRPKINVKIDHIDGYCECMIPHWGSREKEANGINGGLGLMFCCYKTTKEFGVTKVDFCFKISGVALSPAANRKRFVGYSYFDTTTGNKITEEEANINKEKNRTAENFYRQALSLKRSGQNQSALQKINEALQECTNGYVNESTFRQEKDNIWSIVEQEREAINRLISEAEDLKLEAERLFNQDQIERSISKYTEAKEKYHLALERLQGARRIDNTDVSLSERINHINERISAVEREINNLQTMANEDDLELSEEENQDESQNSQEVDYRNQQQIMIINGNG